MLKHVQSNRFVQIGLIGITVFALIGAVRLTSSLLANSHFLSVSARSGENTKTVVDTSASDGRHLEFIDSNIFNYTEQLEPKNYPITEEAFIVSNQTWHFNDPNAVRNGVRLDMTQLDAASDDLRLVTEVVFENGQKGEIVLRNQARVQTTPTATLTFKIFGIAGDGSAQHIEAVTRTVSSNMRTFISSGELIASAILPTGAIEQGKPTNASIVFEENDGSGNWWRFIVVDATGSLIGRATFKAPTNYGKVASLRSALLRSPPAVSGCNVGQKSKTVFGNAENWNATIEANGATVTKRTYTDCANYIRTSQYGKNSALIELNAY